MAKANREREYEKLVEKDIEISKQLIELELNAGTWQEVLAQKGLNAIEKRVAEIKSKQINIKLENLYTQKELVQKEIDIHMGLGNKKTDYEEPIEVGQSE